MKKRRTLDCPAAPHDWDDAIAFGVASGTPEHPEIVPISPEPISPGLLANAAPANPREVFRFAATCVKGACRHWDATQSGAEGDGACTLVQRIIASYAAVTTKPPPCAIRGSCRWWAQQGVKACLACPQIVTDIGDLPQTSEAEQDVAFF